LYFPDDTTIVTDDMLLSLQAGDTVRALAISDEILIDLPSAPYPFYVKGAAAEGAGNIDQALVHYREFLRLSPDDDPEALNIRERVETLRDLQYLRDEAP
jgi:regulator of sirC expression with transglutaminase-like and TPR domain